MKQFIFQYKLQLKYKLNNFEHLHDQSISGDLYVQPNLVNFISTHKSTYYSTVLIVG